MEDRTRRRLTVLAAIFGGVLVAAVVGQGAMILAMGKELKSLREVPPSAGAPATALAVPKDRIAAADPGAPIDEMEKLIDRAFADPGGDPFGLFGAMGGFPAPWAGPAPAAKLALSDSGSDYVVRVEVPGEDAGKVDVRVDGTTLTVQGAYTSSSQGGGQGRGAVASAESGSFSQSLELPGPVDAGRMRATRDRGVLTIVLPKSEANS